MKLISVDLKEINWESLAAEINSVLASESGLARHPRVNFVIGSSCSKEKLQKLTDDVEEQMKKVKAFGPAIKKWLKLPNHLDVFAIIQWPVTQINMEFVVSLESLGIQMDFENDPFCIDVE